MPLGLVYLAVVIIWSTTPLGIVWSSESVSPTIAVFLRMLIAAILGSILIIIKKIPLPWHRQALTLYAYSAMGIFGGMLFSYLAARHLSSGTMSLIFGLAPIFSGLLAQKILAEPKFGFSRQLALVVALSGLALVCLDGLSFDSDKAVSYCLILMAVFFFSLSGVMVKSVDISIHSMASTVGALLVSLPLFFIAWCLLDGTLPIEQWQARSLWAIVYLGFFGSLVGFVAYFYILKRLPASSVSLITMITPVFAILLGSGLNNEPISGQLILGAMLVLLGLVLYQLGSGMFRSTR